MDPRVREALQRTEHERTDQDLEVLYAYLHNVEALSGLPELQLWWICKTAKYESLEGSKTFSRPENCWFVVLSGYISVDGDIVQPGNSFGKRHKTSVKGGKTCLVGETTEVIRLKTMGDDIEEYNIRRTAPLRQSRRRFHRITWEGESQIVTDELLNNRTCLSLSADFERINVGDSVVKSPQHNKHLPHRTSTASDSGASSISEGSSGIQDEEGNGGEEPPSDEEDHETSLYLGHDAFYECLEKDPRDRTDDNIEHLVCMASRLPAFANMTLAVKRELCAVMLLTVVDKAGTVIHHDSEELDSWSVVLNGTAEIRQRDGNRIEIGPGEVYGIGSNMECKIMQGVMKTKTDDYQFVSVMRTDFCRILSRVEESTEREEENGSVVLVREHRVLDRSGTRKGHVVVKASPDRLLRHLVEDRSSADPSFPEDLLLTYRVFVPSPMDLASRLLQWFQNEKQLREKVTRIILLWVNNHFEDFEDDPAMTDILEKFESLLEQEQNMGGHLRLLAIAIDAKTSKRVLTLARPSRHEPLSFTLMITIEGTFVAAVEENGRAERIGLRRGDQILEVNKVNLEGLLQCKVLDLLQKCTHLSMTVRSNLLRFKKLQKEKANLENKTFPQKRWHCIDDKRMSLPVPVLSGNSGDHLVISGKGSMGSVSSRKIRKLMKTLLPGKPSDAGLGAAYGKPTEDVIGGQAVMLPPSVPDQALRVYRADQSCKHMMVSRETTVSEAVALAMQEFQQNGQPSNFALVEVWAGPGGMVRQRRLPPQIADLADRIPLNARYYLTSVCGSEALYSDEVLSELEREGNALLLQLKEREVAAELSLRAHGGLAALRATSLLRASCRLPSHPSDVTLSCFEQMVNNEVLWVRDEVLQEGSEVKRAKLIKFFINVAQQCRKCQNFNSAFAIYSGLSHSSVVRLHGAWDKVSAKQQELYNELQDLFNPSRNMGAYRSALAEASVCPPVIPLYPVVRKDLTFLHDGNHTWVEGLVNFEKLRMIAKEVRQMCRLVSAGKDVTASFRPWSMLAGGGLLMSSMDGGTLSRRMPRRPSVFSSRRLFDESLAIRRTRHYLQNAPALCRSKKETEPPLVDGAAHLPASVIKGPLNNVTSQTKEVALGWTPKNSPKQGQQVKRKVSQRSDLGSSASSISSNSSGHGNSNSNSNNNLVNIRSSCTVAEEHSVTAIRPCQKVSSSNTKSTASDCPALKCEPSGSALQRRFLQLMGQSTRAQRGEETKMKGEEAVDVVLKRKGRELLPARRFSSPFRATRRVRSHSGVRSRISVDASEEAEHPTLLPRKEDPINARRSTSGLLKVMPVAVETDCKQSRRPRDRFRCSFKLGRPFRSLSSDNVPR